jgi:putative ABC transport system ATP-binding protein
MLDVRGLSKVYRRGRVDVPALSDVSFCLEPGHTVAIMGPSGSGKTTLLNLLAGLDRPTAGEVLVDGTRMSALDPEAATAFRRRHIGFIFQFFNLLPTMSARENVALPMLADRRPRREIHRRTAEVLDAVGLAHRADHRPEELSGGEQQRVAIARALVLRPRLLLADEPTGNLDSASGRAVLELLRTAATRDRLAIVLVSHWEDAARAMDRTILLRDGATA